MNKNLTWNPFLMLFFKEILRFKSVAVQTVVTPVITSTLYLLIFGVSLGQNIHLENGLTYLAFIIPGLTMMGVLNNAFQNSSTCIVSGKFTGELEDYKVAPLSYAQIIWALGLGGLLRGVVVGSITLLVGEVFFYFTMGHFLPLSQVFFLLFFVFSGGLIFAFLGLSVALWARNFDQLSIVNSFILLPLIYLGGVFFSLESLSPFWQTISRFNPLFYLINGVRYGILGYADVSMFWAIGVCFLGIFSLFVTCIFSLHYSSFSRW